MATLAKLLVEVGVKIDGALKVEQRVKKLRIETKGFGDQADKSIGLARRAFKKLGQRASKELSKLQVSLQKNLFSLKGFATQAKRAGVAVTAAAVGTFLFVKSQSETLDKINKTSAAVGAGVEEFQRLQFAATQSGVAQDTLTKALEKFNANLFDIEKGSGKLAIQALDDLGLSFEQLRGETRTEQLQLIADGLGKVEDGGKRAAIASKLFGQRAGPQLSILLEEGREGIDALTASARNVLTQEQINEATRFVDLMGETQAEIELVAREVGLALIPAVTDVIEGVRDWIIENEEFIRQNMPAVVDGLSTAVDFFVDTLDRAVSVVEFFNDAIEFQRDIVDRVGIPGIDGLSEAFRNLAFGPVTFAIDAIETATDALREFGIIGSKIEGGTGRAFAKVARGVSAKARRLRQTTGPGGVGRTTGLPPLLARPKERRAPGGGARGGGGGGARKARPARAGAAGAAAEIPGITVDEAISGLLTGGGAVLTERLKGLAAVTPSTRDVKPTVAIDFFNFNIEQNITAPSPIEAGRESADAIRKEFRKGIAQAGQALAGNTVR